MYMMYMIYMTYVIYVRYRPLSVRGSSSKVLVFILLPLPAPRPLRLSYLVTLAYLPESKDSS